jgi:hypothetical protein
MATLNNVVTTTKTINNDLFLCCAFAKAISSDKLFQVIEQQQSIPIISTPIESKEEIPHYFQLIIFIYLRNEFDLEQ